MGVKVPIKEQIIKFKNIQGNIEKLQMTQDWYQDKDNKITEPLEGAEVTVTYDSDEKRYETSMSPLEIEFNNRGNYSFHLKYQNYIIMTGNGQQLGSIDVVVESGNTLQPITIIMIPQE